MRFTLGMRARWGTSCFRYFQNISLSNRHIAVRACTSISSNPPPPSATTSYQGCCFEHAVGIAAKCFISHGSCFDPSVSNFRLAFMPPHASTTIRLSLARVDFPIQYNQRSRALRDPALPACDFALSNGRD